MEVDTGIIYCWRNIRTEKRYIGQTTRPKKRYNEHKRHLGNYDGPNLFGRALNKYFLLSDWEYTIIEEVPTSQLDTREIYWIAFYDSNNPEHGYNMATGGDRHDGYELSEEVRKKISESMKGKPGTMNGKKHSEEVRKKMSESHKGRTHSEEVRKKLSESNKGRTHSEEARKKMSESHKGKTLSEEARKKMSTSKNPNKIAVYQNDSLIVVCDTLGEAGHIANVSTQSINQIIHGKYLQTRSGYSFKYIPK